MSAWAEGLLGAVMGGTGSMVHSMDEEEKARRIREEREANKRDQITLYERQQEIAQRMKLQLEELERGRLGKAATEAEAALPAGKPAWSGNKQGDAIDAGEVSELPLTPREKAEKRADFYAKKGETGLVRQELERAEKAARDEDRDALVGERVADRAFRDRQLEQNAKDREADRGAAERRHKEAMDAARDAREGNWKVDDKGRYVRPDGSLVTRQIREGGRLLGEEPVYARTTPPKEKSDRDFVQQQILALKRKSFRTPEEEADLRDLEDEYGKLTGKKSPGAPAAGAKPWQRSWDGKAG